MKAKTVRELMTTDVIKLSKEQAIPLAQELMRMMRVRHLPVVGSEDELVGMVTHRSLLGAQVELLSQMAGDKEVENELTIPVAKVMTTQIQTVSPDALVSEALKKMLDARQGVVVVVEAGKIVGVLTSQDFLTLMLEEPEPAIPAADQLAKLAAHEAVAQMTASVARSQPTAPRWVVWLLTGLLMLLAISLIAQRLDPIPIERDARMMNLVRQPKQRSLSNSALLERHPRTDASPSFETTLPRREATDRGMSRADRGSSVPDGGVAVLSGGESMRADDILAAGSTPERGKPRTSMAAAGGEQGKTPILQGTDARAPIAPDDQLPLPEDVASHIPQRQQQWIPEPIKPLR